MSSYSHSAYGDNVVSLNTSGRDDPMLRADADLRHVIDILAELGGKPAEQLTPARARAQPGLKQALAKVLEPSGRSLDDAGGVAMEELGIPSPEGEIPARLYRSEEAPGAGEKRPMILYLHGGGWVTGGLDESEPVARLIARQTGAAVISAGYRLAPEHRFPAAHDDAYTAWLWMIENAAAFDGDASRAAVFGEDAGANLALNVALQARDEAMVAPVHSVLISPIAGSDMSARSYVENMRAKPFGTPAMQWYFRHAFASRADAADPRIDLVGREDLAGLKPVTLILAELDPLRSDGEALAHNLNAADVWVDAKIYDGVGHGFFPLGMVVTKARFAEGQAINNLKQALALPLSS